MRISKDSKLGVAMSVLRKIDVKANDVGIDMYSNCREQGFFVTSFHKNCPDILNRRAVSFAENRNSDDIIVQFGNKNDFNDYGIFKSDEMYEKNKKYFRYDDAEGAAEFVSKWLKHLI